MDQTCHKWIGHELSGTIFKIIANSTEGKHKTAQKISNKKTEKNITDKYFKQDSIINVNQKRI